MKKGLCVFLSVLLLFLLSSCAVNMFVGDFKNDSSLEDVFENHKLVVGMEYDFNPMGTLNPETGEAYGFDVDLARIVAGRLGVEAEFVYVPWMDDILSLKHSRANCIWNGFQKTPEREGLYALSIPYIRDRQVFMIRKETTYKSLYQLTSKPLGVIDPSAGKYAMNNTSNQNFRNSIPSIIDLVTYKQGIEFLDLGIIDALLSDEVVAKHYISENPEKYKLLNENSEDAYISTMEVAVAFRRRDNRLKTEINRILFDLSSEGIIKQLCYEWFGENLEIIPYSAKSIKNK